MTETLDSKSKVKSGGRESANSDSDSNVLKSFPERVFSGVQPSGAQVHLGNYLGAMKRFVTLAERFPTIICVVDLHALTSVEDPGSSSNTRCRWRLRISRSA